MAELTDTVRILLVDDDDLLISDAQALDQDGVKFAIARSTTDARLYNAATCFDVVVISLDVAGGEDLMREWALSPHSDHIIALAGRAASGVTLEHTLIRAELRGAALALPRPVDAVEVALAAVTATAGVRAPQGACAALMAGLERRLIC